MPPYLSLKSKRKIKIFGWYQLIGGVVGLLLTIWLLARAGQMTGILTLLFLVAFGLYIFSCYCGWLLVKNNFIKGLNLSVVNQALQVLHFAMFGYAYSFSSGLLFSIGMGIKQGLVFNFDAELTSTWQLSVGTNSTSFILAINLVAIYFLYFIEKLKTAIQQESKDFEEVQSDDDWQKSELDQSHDTVADEPA
jgi:hypothetical protein